MPLSVRLGVGSLDDVLSSVRVHHYLAGTVVCAFDKRRLSLAVMGLLNDEGDVLEVSTDSLGALSALLATPFSSDVIRLAYPRVDLNLSGQVMLRVPVDEPVWSRVLTNVELDVQAGLRVSGDDIRDALSVSLDALGVPSGSVVAERSFRVGIGGARCARVRAGHIDFGRRWCGSLNGLVGGGSDVPPRGGRSSSGFAGE